MRVRVLTIALTLLCALATGMPAPTAAANPTITTFAAAQDVVVQNFTNVWARTDGPQVRGDRSFIWGPAPVVPVVEEPLAGAPGGKRAVLYWDKSRMEVNDPAAPQDKFYVSNGLLVSEMVSGQIQIGLGANYAPRTPANVPFGDLNDPTSPTYASFRDRLADPPLAAGQPVAQQIDRAGQVSAADPGGVTCQVVENRHCIAAPFWTFLNATGPILEGGRVTTGLLFDPTFSVTGLPIAEAYWITLRAGGRPTRVLIQLFERRTLTFNPANSPATQVEMGNVGLQYYHWRYDATLADNTGLDPKMREALTLLNGAAPSYQYLVGNLTGGRYQLLFQGLSGTGAEAITIPAYRLILFDDSFTAQEGRNLAGVLGHEAQHAYDIATYSGDKSANECYALELRGFLVGSALWQGWYGPGGKPNPANEFERTENQVLALLRADPARFVQVLINGYRDQCGDRGPGGPDRLLMLEGLPAGIAGQLPVEQTYAALRQTLATGVAPALEAAEVGFTLPRR